MEIHTKHPMECKHEQYSIPKWNKLILFYSNVNYVPKPNWETQGEHVRPKTVDQYYEYFHHLSI